MDNTHGRTKKRHVGWQIVNTETDNPPAGLMTYEVHTDLAAVLAWFADLVNPQHWRLIPIFEGDVEGPCFIEDVPA